jgi:hypothetical protein
VLAEFDRDAQSGGLSATGRWTDIRRPPAPFSKPWQIGDSDLVAGATLQKPSIAIEQAPPLMRPLEVLRAPDQAVMDGAWSNSSRPSRPPRVWSGGGLRLSRRGFFPVVILPFRRRRPLQV